MKNLAIFGAALLFATSSAGVMAQGLSVQGNGSVGADVGVGVESGGNPAIDANSSLQTGIGAAVETKGVSDNGLDTYGSLISSLSNSAAVDLSSVDSSTNVRIVEVSSLQGKASADANALDQALAKNQDRLADLRTSLKAETEIATRLEARGYTTDDVVAASARADGSLVLYVDDRG